MLPVSRYPDSRKRTMPRMILCMLTLGMGFVGSLPARPIDHPPVAVAGRGSAGRGGPMEGVLVRAKGAGSTVSVTVVTDRNGAYAFPASRLAPRTYILDIRAV